MAFRCILGDFPGKVPIYEAGTSYLGDWASATVGEKRPRSHRAIFNDGFQALIISR